MRSQIGLTSLLWCLMESGCARTIPRYPRMDASQAMARMTERSRQIKTLTSSCRLVLMQSDGRSIQLQAALAMRSPDHLRLRAWKASQAVFDLTLRPDGLWLYVADSSDEPLGSALNDITAGRVVTAWGVLVSGFDAHQWTVVADSPDRLQLSSKNPADFTLLCDIDQTNLTLRHCQMRAPDGTIGMSLHTDRYRPVDGFVWPGRVSFDSAQGSIVVLIDDPSINEELPEQAFEPPSRAVRKP